MIEGAQAPNFTLTSDSGDPVRLSDELGRGPVVLFFYPKDATPGCTIEAGAFAKEYAAFRELGAQVIGVSSDDQTSHRRFKEQCGLPYPLLSDTGGTVRAAYGVPKTFGMLPGRTTYVIDKTGIVQSIYTAQFKADRHPAEALDALRRMR